MIEVNYVFYDALGQIVQWGSMPRDAVDLTSATIGLPYVLGFGHPSECYVDIETKQIVKGENPLVPPVVPHEPNDSPP